jgi:hypothetical protein
MKEEVRLQFVCSFSDSNEKSGGERRLTLGDDDVNSHSSDFFDGLFLPFFYCQEGKVENTLKLRTFKE